MKRKKPLKEVCGNCKLFDNKKRVCRIVVLHEGNKINIPVDPEDSCFFDQKFFDPVTLEQDSLLNYVKEIKFWVEDEEGNKTDGYGKVKVEYPEDGPSLGNII